MNRSKRVLTRSAIFTVIATVLLTTTIAKAQNSRHTLGSANDVYRVELRNVSQFQVMGVSDSDGTDELHNIKLELRTRSESLSTNEQYDTVNIPSISLFNRSRNLSGNTAYVAVKESDVLTIGGRSVPDESRNLWAHSRDRYSSGQQASISIHVHGRDLDCKGTNLCRRGDTENFSVHFRFPELTSRPPASCGATNTYKISRLDEGLALFGPDGGVIEKVAYRVRGGGPRIRPINGEICIASTKMPLSEKLRRPDSVSSDRKNEELQKRR